MKSIKEIGSILCRHPGDGGLIPFDKNLEDSHHVIIITIEERRELVRAVWSAARIKIDFPYETENGTKGTYKEYGQTAEEFIKDNEL